MTRRTYLSGEEGRAAYQAQAARDATPRGDPQRTAGWQDPRDTVAAMMRPCATLLPGGGTCAAPMAEHHVPERKDRREVRTYCTRQEGPRRCPCERYTPGHWYGPDGTEEICRWCEVHVLDAGAECESTAR